MPSLLVFAIAIFAISIISVQTSIYSVNKSIEASEEKLLSQQKTNDDLKVQVNDLGRYERILKLAKEKGLSLNGDNVKVVDGK
ncbi:cell division protein FtsL [Listeria fleischmannii FSL S10-1203]|uniref:Cell division protein FtsL n=1 Tax=Listeria fleischmannii FSL S10-1203 TaxID=1265822 RepID=W7DP42_9LIST|nr:cell division protein FtsL [Listeria fleischmannii FSL S10-1203]